MSEVYSVSYASENENGMQEATIEYHKSFLRCLFHQPAKKIVAIAPLGSIYGPWYAKDGVSYISIEEQNIIINMAYQCERALNENQ